MDLGKRTVIVYLGRDSNLANNDEEKIKYMLEGWDGKRGNLLIYQDRKGEMPVLLDAYSENGENKTRVIQEYEKENSASPKVLKRVINDAKALHPAGSYGLIVFSHGSGWLPQGAYNTLRSIITDSPSDSEMELIDFTHALSAGSIHFDYIVFEACFMAGIEVAYELRHVTDYILASSAEIVSPGFWTTYSSSMNTLFQRKADLKAFAKAAFSYVENQSGAWQSGTLSVINTSELYALTSFLQANLPAEPLTDIDGIQYFDRKKNHTFFDFEDYFSRMLENDDLKKELTSLVEKCVVYKAATPVFFESGFNSFEINKHSGLTTYIMQDIFPELNQAYKKLSWYKDIYE